MLVYRMVRNIKFPDEYWNPEGKEKINKLKNELCKSEDDVKRMEEYIFKGYAISRAAVPAGRREDLVVIRAERFFVAKNICNGADPDSLEVDRAWMLWARNQSKGGSKRSVNRTKKRIKKTRTKKRVKGVRTKRTRRLQRTKKRTNITN